MTDCFSSSGRAHRHPAAANMTAKKTPNRAAHGLQRPINADRPEAWESDALSSQTESASASAAPRIASRIPPRIHGEEGRNFMEEKEKGAPVSRRAGLSVLVGIINGAGP